MKKILKTIKKLFLNFSGRIRVSKEFIFGMLLYYCMLGQSAFAGVLSSAICRPYKNLVDDDLFMVVSAIAAIGLLIAWKTTGGGKVLGSAISLLAALMVALNLENLLQLATGRGMFC